MTCTDPAAATLGLALRQDRGRILAALVARLGDFQLAEDALQEACEAALRHWSGRDPPRQPAGWLIRVAFRKAIDRLRAVQRRAVLTAELAVLAEDAGTPEGDMDPEMIPDARLALIFTCCHPALDPKSRVALTLRSIAGLTTSQIARAFLDTDTTMGQRISRAKAKIAAARIPFAIPGPEDWPDRLQSVLAVVYLIFNAGYSAGPDAEGDLCGEAIFLARLLARLRPAEAEIEGCLALLLLTHARHGARVGADGVTVPLLEQDRSLWDRSAIAEGLEVIDRAMARRDVGPYQIKAAIAACHIAEPGPDWPQIVALYTRLLDFEPTPVVRLNRAVALAETGALRQALADLAALEPMLRDYQPFHAARAELLARAGQGAAARQAYDLAIGLASCSADAAFLIIQRDRWLN